MVTDSAALVLFAIRSALKLGQQLRLAYVDNTRRRELLLPLPNFFSSPDIVSATNYFAGPGERHVAVSARLAALLEKQKAPGQSLTTGEESELRAFHSEFFNVDLALNGRLGEASDGSSLSADELNALITIRQWRRGTDPNPPVVQRLDGTLVEIGVDYFLNVPGALNKNSSYSKVIAGVLDGLSQINFAEEQLRDLPVRLFAASAETISAHPEWLSGNSQVQELVKVATRAISANTAARLEQLQAGGNSDLVKEQRVLDWAELVFRSVVSSAGNLVLTDPRRYLGVQGDAESALVTQVGHAVLGLVLDQDKLDPQRLFSIKGLEKIVQAALAVLGEHPEILISSKNAGLQKLLAEIATQLSQFDTPLTPDLLPELTRQILSKTGENLSLLWPNPANKPGTPAPHRRQRDPPGSHPPASQRSEVERALQPRQSAGRRPGRAERGDRQPELVVERSRPGGPEPASGVVGGPDGPAESRRPTPQPADGRRDCGGNDPRSRCAEGIPRPVAAGHLARRPTCHRRRTRRVARRCV